jgi:O-antigen/teichoic acid export membrane protein
MAGPEGHSPGWRADFVAGRVRKWLQSVLERLSPGAGPDATRYVENFTWLMADRIVRLVGGLLIGIAVARHLGPGRLGILNYALSLVGLFTSLAYLGLDGVVTRRLVEEPSKCGTLLGTAFVLRLAASSVLVTVIILATHLSPGEPVQHAVTSVVSLMLVFGSLQVVNLYLVANVLSKFFALVSVVQFVALCGVKIVLIVTEAPLVFFAMTWAAEPALILLGLLTVSARLRISPATWRFDWRVGRELLSDGWPIIFAGVCSAVYARIDQVMIRWFMTSESVGLYAVAVRIAEMVFFVPGILCGTVFPAIVKARAVDRALYRERLQKLYALMIWLALGFSVPVALLSPWIVRALFGAEFTGAGPALAIQVWGSVFVFVGVVFDKYLLAENQQRKALVKTVLGAVSNVGLNCVLIPLWGIRGAALATCISYAVYGYFSMLVFPSTRFNFALATRCLNPFVAFRLLLGGGQKLPKSN